MRRTFRRGAGGQRLIALTVALLVALTACTGGRDEAVTVTSTSTAVEIAVHSAPAPRSLASSAHPTSARTTSTSGAGTSAKAIAPRSAVTALPNGNGGVPAGGTEPDGFRITKLKPGQRPPQFIVFSFDGVGWDEKWRYWFGIMQKVPLHFTGFLSGTYLLSKETKDKYHRPGHDIGESAITLNEPADLPVEIKNLNKSLALGNEVGSHFNGHFCDPGDSPGGKYWKDYDWNNELDQFFGLVQNVDLNNDITVKLNLPAAEIRGERTPCLEGGKDDLYPALEAHGMDYDSTFTKTGLSWPVKSADGKVWETGMSEFPLHGTGHPQITMDYNFYAQHEPDTVLGGAAPSLIQSKADSAQVLATYQDMLHAAETDGVNEPLIIGNHFNAWNNNAYSDAVANFALSACARPRVACVPFRDLVDWMNAQDPKVVAALQDHRSNLGGCPYLAWPKCDGLIQY